MLLKLWRWLIGTPSPSRTDVLLETLIESQGRTQQAMLTAIAAIEHTAERQAEVLSQYLKLFQTPGEPERWTFDMEQENKAELAKLGFPSGATEAEQAEWVLTHLEQL